jgi:hypothetical protein
MVRSSSDAMILAPHYPEFTTSRYVLPLRKIVMLRACESSMLHRG